MIVHRRGAQNANANALSRIGSISRVKDQSDVPDENKRKRSCMNFTIHRGMNKTYHTIKSHYTWPNMKREVKEYVKQCRSCQVNKTVTPKHKALMEITTA